MIGPQFAPKDVALADSESRYVYLDFLEVAGTRVHGEDAYMDSCKHPQFFLVCRRFL